jgi:CheY-like chemotaxis protein
LSQPAAERAPDALAPAVPAPGLRVLIVDDNVDAARTLGMALAAHGVAHRIVHDGPGALAMADAFAPDAVLLDIGMPGMDGYEVARRLRVHPVHRAALLVALTGWSHAQDHVQSRAAGFDHHLRKPADVDDLLRLLATVAPRTAAAAPPPAGPALPDVASFLRY